MFLRRMLGFPVIFMKQGLLATIITTDYSHESYKTNMFKVIYYLLCDSLQILNIYVVKKCNV